MDEFSRDGRAAQRQFAQFRLQPCAIGANRIDEGIDSVCFQRQVEGIGGLLHQLPLAGSVPDRGKWEALFLGVPLFDALLQCFARAQPTIRFGGVH